MIEILGKRIERWECFYKECKALCCKAGRKITVKDAKNIIKLTKKNLSEFADDKNNIFLKLNDRGDGYCFFLNNDYECGLHARAKPILCELFPFQFKEIVYSDEVIVRVTPAENCPGYGRGKILSEEFMVKLEEKGVELVREIERTVRLKNEGKSLREMVLSE